MGASGGRRRLVTLAGLLIALGLLLAGCGPGTVAADRPSAETPVSLAPPDEPVTSAPATGEESLPPDQGGGGGAAVDLPRLPVGGGGAFVDAGQDLQCAPISWTAFGGAAGLDRGVSVEVVGYTFDTDHFRVADGGCDGPSCVHYVFGSTGSATGCTVAIRTVRPQPSGTPVTSLFLVGQAHCDRVSATACQAFVAAVGRAAGEDSTIDLVAPDPSSESASPSESPSPVESPSAGESPLPSGTATADASPTA